ncbi:MAG: family 78 glycoside hydrolase catalytic domain [Armatimonadota bacterium]
MDAFNSAQWIWTDLDDGSMNVIVCARKSFALDEAPQFANLDISADSRYVLYVNGERIANGPMRSWNHLKQYDSLEIAPWLKAGENTLAVMVTRYGVASGQYMDGPGGLIAQLNIDDQPVLSTDASWKWAVHNEYKRSVPRLAWGIFFTEQLTADPLFHSWMQPDFDDSDWQPGYEMGPVGTEPFVQMQTRSLPLLTEQYQYPRSLSDARVVQTHRNSFAFSIQRQIMKIRGPHEPENGSSVLLTFLVSDKPTKAIWRRMNASFGLDAIHSVRLNHTDVTFKDDVAEIELKAGENLLVVRLHPGMQSHPSWVFETDAELRLLSPKAVKPGPAAIYVLPAGADIRQDKVANGLWDAHCRGCLGSWLSNLQPITWADSYTDVYALANTRQPVGVRAVVFDTESMCSDNSQFTTIIPCADGDTELLLDFGEEIAGYLDFELISNAGVTLDFYGMEAIVDGKWSWTDNLNNTLRYTCMDGLQSYRSEVRMAFRYLTVTVRNATAPMRIRRVRLIQNTYPVQYLGEFASSDGMLNQIYDISRRTTRLCMEDTFVDCPAYEQTYWVGDSRNEALANMAVFGDGCITKRCLRLAAESMWRAPMPESHAPARGFGIIPDWSFFWAFAIHEYYLYTADIEFVKEMAPYVQRMCDFLLDQRGETGLVQYAAWNMLDWAPMECPPGGAITHENAFFVKALHEASELLRVAGLPGGERYLAEAEALKAAINQHLWDESEGGYRDANLADGTPGTVFSQQSQTVAYLCDIASGPREERVAGMMKQCPDTWTKVGSPFMMWFSFEALEKAGDKQTILDWMRRWWGEMIEYGATTCWETYASWSQGRWAPSRSWCHAWSAAPAYFLPSMVLGVRPVAPGFKKAVVAPFPGDLQWAKGRVPTPYGQISVSWKLIDGKMNLTVIHPAEVDVEIVLPAGVEMGEVKKLVSSFMTSPEGIG